MNLWLQFGLMMLFPLGAIVLVAVLLRHREGQHPGTISALALALTLNGIWASGLAAAFAGRGVSPSLIRWWQRAADYALPLAAAAILFATLAYLRYRRPRYRKWSYALLAGLGLVLILDPAILPLGLPDLHVAYRVISHQGVWQISWTLLSIVPSLAAVVSLVENYPRKAGPLYRNRIRYWVIATGVNLIGDALAVSREPILMQAGALVKLLAGTVATISVLAHQLPDIRVVLRRAIGMLAVGALTFAVFMLAMMGGQLIYRDVPSSQVLWAMSGLALLLVLVFYPLRYLVTRGLDRLTSLDAFDTDVVLRDYGARISPMLELDGLAKMILETVDRALGVDHGTLVLVEGSEDRPMILRPILAPDLVPLPAITAALDSPFASYLDNDQPLSQYDLDTLPAFAGLSATLREALTQWGGEFYVPLHSRGRPVGLLALGAKRSETPYSNADVDLLQTMADRTAAALENAQLLFDLRELNEEVTELNKNLEWANLELLELDKLKTSFISIITHELRSPFVPIDLALQVVKRYGLENMLPEQRDQIQELGDHLAELRRTIDNLIAYASLVSKQRALQLKEFSLNDLVQDAVTTLNMMATARRVTVEAVMVQGLPSVWADRERISDAIYHLIHNGIKFNRSGGMVNVRCAHGDGQVTIAVADTGRGIPADRLDTLGDPFTQIADPMRRGIEGVGLGLALVKYIVQAHAGELRMESELGVGSTFTMILPVEGPTGQGVLK